MAEGSYETNQENVKKKRKMPLAVQILLRLIGTAAVLIYLISQWDLFFKPAPELYLTFVPPLQNQRGMIFWALVLLTLASGAEAVWVNVLKKGKRETRYAFDSPLAVAATFAVIFVNAVLSFYEVELINNYYINEVMEFRYHVLGWFITFFIYLILVFLTNSLSMGMTIGNWLFLVWALVNYFVLRFRGVPFQWIDFGSMRTGMSVSGNYTYTFTWQMVTCLVLTCAVTGFYIHARVWHNFGRTAGKVGSRVISAALIFSFWGLIFQTDFLEGQGIWLRDWQPWYTYRLFGMESGFFAFAKASYPEAPDSYSKEHVKEIISNSENESKGASANESLDVPENVICIMDEAFSDFSIYPNFKADQEVLPYLNSLTGSENFQDGRMLVSVKGGTTANTEYEFLTGNSCVISPQTVVYNSFIKEDQFSLARILKAQGYDAIALHPYGKYGWNRQMVYPRMGFDDFLTIDNDFQGAAKVRDFVSDKADFERLIDYVKNKKRGQKLFLFNITMQNHSAYNNPSLASTIHVPDFNGENKGQAEQYLTLTHMTDEALKELIDYFSGLDEKTLIVFWGDHQPQIGDDFWEYCLGKDSMSDLDIEEQELTYETRYFIWANYDIPEKQDQVLSANYLSSYLMTLTGLTRSGYQNFLLQQRQTIPAMNSYGYLGTDGAMHAWGSDSAGKEETRMLDDYECLIYNELTGGSGRDESFFGVQ
ncbi:MAG: LTA synthase family protein [Lachnospiraceae bacterium]|nr:LTA synthase family protein [Lachnospiraceae bacterium]